MDRLFQRHDDYIRVTPTEYVRDFMDKVSWDSRLVCIRGPKGVGKSTLLRQRIKLNYAAGDRHVLYCSADSGYFSNHSLLDTAGDFVKLGEPIFSLMRFTNMRNGALCSTIVYDRQPFHLYYFVREILIYLNCSRYLFIKSRGYENTICRLNISLYEKNLSYCHRFVVDVSVVLPEGRRG